MDAAERDGTLGGVSSPTAGATAAQLTATELRAWRAISESSQLLGAILDRKLKDGLGLSHADYGVLRRLQEAEGNELSMRALRHEVWFSRSRLTHQVNRLVAAGFLKKFSDVSDGRLQVVALTPVGVDLVIRAQQIVRQSLHEHFFEQLPPASENRLAVLLSGLVEHLREQPECQAFRNS
ncbi:MarR family winged helix-turn-helix transcriptional regulator [Rhodococcus sp. NPDC060176]|uniref:MarR family winged helix-turn-helix transcriptional regulator n=1 Tax=Rhodococcus sp. NPDC060176 TaxID=3347062 RepID=UPI003667F75F